jgi:8-oxo-dGTP diphosphatase
MAKEYKSEDEFLKDYDISKFDQLSMTADILLISVSDHETSNYRKTNKKTMSILLVKRNEYPYKDKWCLPGGFLNPKNETLEECAMRVLKQETNLENIYLEQLYTFDDPKRDPRTRVVSTSYMALIDKNKLTQMINKNASWFDVVLLEDNEKEVTITLTNGVDTIHVNVKKELREKTTGRYTVTSLDNKDLAFDHDLVIVTGLERLRNKLSYTDIVFNMMPEYFTLGELQKVYEVILNKKLLDPAFRRIIANKVEKTDKMKTGEGHRPSALFKYKG